MVKPHICVCICTYRRPQLLERLLSELDRQEVDDRFTYSVVVVDNDSEESARDVISAFANRAAIPVVYCVEARRNIALARNRAVAHARGDYIAFVDDDELPARDWLLILWKTCESLGVDGVLGPVLPRFEATPPQWVIVGKFYERPRYDTGFRMDWSECRTGNVLIRRGVVTRFEEPFREEFGSGGEDQDFFRRAIEHKYQFVWCNEAPVYEWVPKSRCAPAFLLRRALLRGKNSLRHPQGRFVKTTKSLVAVPSYCLVILVLLIGQSQYLMKYCVKLMDHVGRLLALVRFNPIKQRPM